MDTHTCVPAADAVKIQVMAVAELQSLGLGEIEERVYEALLKTPDGTAADLARLLALSRSRLDTALERLTEHGFTVPSEPGRPAGTLPTAASPAAAIRTLIHRRQAELHLRAAELERLWTSADRIAGRLMSGSPTTPEGSIELVTGARQISERAQSMVAAAEREVLIFDRPPYVRDDDGDPDFAPLDVGALLGRGIAVRSVIDREGLAYPGRLRSLTALVERGLRVRFTAGVPTKLIAVDRRVSLLPPTDTTDPTASALVVGDALLHNVLVPLFELTWQQATPMAASAGPLPEPQKELLGLLVAGLKDEAIARRLGIHVHTARRRISQLLESLGAETRFQAGAQAVRRGWLDS